MAATNIDVFVGLGGPYFLNGGASTASNATGLALTNVNLAFGLFVPTALGNFHSYFALQLTAASASLVGMGPTLTLNAQNVAVVVNQSYNLIGLAGPGIDFTQLGGGGLPITAGGTTVTLNSSQVGTVATVGIATLQISQFVSVTASLAFTVGARTTITTTTTKARPMARSTITSSASHSPSS